MCVANRHSAAACPWKKVSSTFIVVLLLNTKDDLIKVVCVANRLSAAACPWKKVISTFIVVLLLNTKDDFIKAVITFIRALWPSDL